MPFLCLGHGKMSNFWSTHIYVIKRKLLTALTHAIFFPLEDNLHMFVQPCNTRYLLHTVTGYPYDKAVKKIFIQSNDPM